MAKEKNDKLNLPMDYGIKAYKVRVIQFNNQPDKVMNRDDAIELAKSVGMNLVQIAYNPNNEPRSICKIIDYAKFKYEEKKRQKEQLKKNRANRPDLKEIKFTIRCDDGDKNTKVNHIKEFLAHGDLVKISIVMSRREMDRINYAKDMMKSLLTEFDGLAKIEGTPSLENRVMSCVLKKI